MMVRDLNKVCLKGYNFLSLALVFHAKILFNIFSIIINKILQDF